MNVSHLVYAQINCIFLYNKLFCMMGLMMIQLVSIIVCYIPNMCECMTMIVYCLFVVLFLEIPAYLKLSGAVSTISLEVDGGTTRVCMKMIRMSVTLHVCPTHYILHV